ncbi:MAG: hypothetical protein ACOVOR_00605 [Rhabdochlamydiaceae bacterium]
MFRHVLLFCLFMGCSASCFSTIIIDEYMSKEEKKELGLDQLSYQEFVKLENWLNKHFIPKKTKEDFSKQLVVLENLNGGKEIVLSDGRIFEIHPEDRHLSASWISPASIEVQDSQEALYPFYLKNSQTESLVRAKKLTVKTLS